MSCAGCVYRYQDKTVGVDECDMIDEMSRDEIVSFYENEQDGCPYRKVRRDNGIQRVVRKQRLRPK